MAICSISGVVQHGTKQARLLGFPTANMPCPGGPCEGVYAACSRLASDPSCCYPSLAYIKDGLLETYLIDASIDLYGKHMEVALTEFIRLPIPYVCSATMQQQILQDLLYAKLHLHSENYGCVHFEDQYSVS